MTLRKSSSTTLLERAADRTTEAVGSAIELTGEFIENTARPVLHDAAAKAAPLVAAGATVAAERASQAKEYAGAKSAELAELAGRPKPKPRKGRKLLMFALLGGLAAVLAVVARKLGGGSSSEWTSPAPSSTPESPAETVSTDESVDDLTTPINKPPFSSN